MTSDSPIERTAPRGGRRAWLYFQRACRLRCPHCGKEPMFVPLLRTRSLRDWFTPLDGCPRCGYPYEREIGYFLMSIWAVGYGFGALLGIAVYFYLETQYHFSFARVLSITVATVVVFAFFFARHAKALFLAFDHFFDPPVPDQDGDDGGTVPTTPASRAPTDLIRPG